MGFASAVHGVELCGGVGEEMGGEGGDECLFVGFAETALHEVHACKYVCWRLACHFLCFADDVDDASVGTASKEDDVVALLDDEVLFVTECIVFCFCWTIEKVVA